MSNTTANDLLRQAEKVIKALLPMAEFSYEHSKKACAHQEFLSEDREALTNAKEMIKSIGDLSQQSPPKALSPETIDEGLVKDLFDALSHGQESGDTYVPDWETVKYVHDTVRDFYARQLTAPTPNINDDKQ
jgi:hypothetical protein